MNKGKIVNKLQRKRARNIFEAEEMILIYLVQQYIDILENKKSDSVLLLRTSKDKRCIFYYCRCNKLK